MINIETTTRKNNNPQYLSNADVGPSYPVLHVHPARIQWIKDGANGGTQNGARDKIREDTNNGGVRFLQFLRQRLPDGKENGRRWTVAQQDR